VLHLVGQLLIYFMFVFVTRYCYVYQISMAWVRHVACMGQRWTHKEFECQEPLSRYRCTNRNRDRRQRDTNL